MLVSFGDDEFEVEVGTAGQVTWDTSTIQVQGPGGSITSSQPATEPDEPSTNWASIFDAVTSWGKRSSTPAAPTAPTSKVPDWVWLALPVGAGALVLMMLASAARRPQLAGYRKRRLKRRR